MADPAGIAVVVSQPKQLSPVATPNQGSYRALVELAAVDSCREAGRISDALRLALDYPHLKAARTVFRLHTGEALVHLERWRGRGRGWPALDEIIRHARDELSG